MKTIDVIIIGAGAAGLMCAIEAGKRNRSVVLLDHANKPGKKILMSGGGRCNFTNYHISPEKYLSHNPHFFKSALSQYTQWDFLALVKKHGIAFHEKKHGQLFCDEKAKDILNMLLSESNSAGVALQLEESVSSIERRENHGFIINTNKGQYACQSLVIATGGLSIPTMGATPFGYKVAEQFNIKVWPTRAGLVPFTLQPKEKDILSTLSGVSQDCLVSSKSQSFRENILFTHRGISGPAILQISSYWQPGETITINMLPDLDLFETIQSCKQENTKITAKTLLEEYIPKRVVNVLLEEALANKPLSSLSTTALKNLVTCFQSWQLKPSGTEGYRTAEVTLGGVDVNALSSKTMECNTVKGLYFIGEVVDVTGWLGGYNFQWAWSSGWVAGQVV